MRAKRIDANQPQIVAAFRKAGWSVAITSELGNGFGDLVVAKNRRTAIIEIKDGSKPPSQQKLTTKEKQFHDAWQGHIEIITSIEDVENFVLHYG